MRILIVGDTHQDYKFWDKVVVPTALEHNCYVMLQLGDFGYWEHTMGGIKYLYRLSQLLEERGQEMFWVDGNHENHEWLNRIYVGDGAQRLKPKSIRPYITYLPRGCKIELGGKQFLACGGAYSIDKSRRTEGESWWPGEMIRSTDVPTCKSQGKVDVVLSHDAPFDYEIRYEGQPFGHTDRIDHPQTMRNREMLTEVVKNSRAKLVLHGHWHRHYDRIHEGVRVVGLDCNWGETPSLAVLETNDLSLAFPDPYTRLVQTRDLPLHQLEDQG